MGDLLVKKIVHSGVSDRSWLANDHGVDATKSIILDASKFDKTTYWSDGWLKAGLALGQNTSTKMYEPYAGTTDEVQVLTVGGSGLTSFTVTFGGQTTGAIVAAATAAQVQTALEALSTIGVGNVLVTGSAGGPWTLAWRGTLADTNVAQVTATPTGGSGTVTPSTTTAGGAAGGSDGAQTFAGLLFTDVEVLSASSRITAALFRHGFVIQANLPANSGIDAPAIAAAAGRLFFE